MNDATARRIRQRAYELFLQRGGRPGDDLRDWLKAEQEILDHERGYRGPARVLDSTRCGKVTDPDGCDIENPT
jgi:Protein of unknown function (DUF2934)